MELKDNDELASQLGSFRFGDSSASNARPKVMPWSSWQEMPESPPSWLKEKFVFLEVFSGLAGLSKEVFEKGVVVLPPIDKQVGGFVRSSSDIFDSELRKKVLRWIRAGVVDLVHFGTPCTTYSEVRREDDGGPPPLRSKEFPRGLP